MNLTDEERKALVEYRIQRANETWRETQEIIKSHLWYAAANRMYYACYYMTSALLISHGLSANTHAGVIRMLGMHFVSKGLLSNEMGYFYSRLFEIRQTGDYDDWVMISEKDIIPLSEQVENYFSSVLELIKNR
ncbi:MAG: HEPN domain-containing protein [Bacteroidales bacterium]|nr:HEPN domain-containing protein [Bacteroidales bacterium]